MAKGPKNTNINSEEYIQSFNRSLHPTQLWITHLDELYRDRSDHNDSSGQEYRGVFDCVLHVIGGCIGCICVCAD